MVDNETARCAGCGREMVREESTFRDPYSCARGGDDSPEEIFFLVNYGRWRCLACPASTSPREPLPSSDLLNGLRERWRRRTYVTHGADWRPSITDYDLRSRASKTRSRSCPEGRWAVECRHASVRDGRVKLILRAVAKAETHKVPIELPMNRSRFSPFGMLLSRWLALPEDVDLPVGVEKNWDLTRKTLEMRPALMYVGRDDQGYVPVDVEPSGRAVS